jgi:hypothetical protein
MYMFMRKIFTKIIVIVAAVFTLAACGLSDARKFDRLVGEWHYTCQESGVSIDIYLALYGDNSFDLYQKVGEGPHYLYKGTFEFSEDVLVGTYSDYTPWAHDYTVTTSKTTLTMTSVADPKYTLSFTKEAIPESVRTHYMPVTKAEDQVLPIL